MWQANSSTLGRFGIPETQPKNGFEAMVPFASGSGRPGDRVQVWNGVVQSPWINETFELTLRIDPRELRMPSGSALSFESFFEIETIP